MGPRKTALWRYQEIEDLLDESLSGHERRALLRRLTRVPVRWPSGADRPLSEATLYRWLRRYRARGLEGLKPRPRRDRGRRQRLKQKVLDRAVALLREEPRRSLTMLCELLRVEVNAVVSRSTLHRHLQAHSAYPGLRREAKGDLDRRLRRRFQAAHPHEIWQGDSKGPFPVRFHGSRIEVPVHVLTIIDDLSRATLASAALKTPDLRSAVLVFRAAARRWGLPDRFYTDRASVFDSKAFRSGLAELGVHRIRSRPRNAAARGKIEAFHRILVIWFLRELRHQVVHDLDHLQRLLTGLLESLYMEHRHRGLRMSPRQALAGRLSDRQVSTDRLLDAFLVRVRKKSHPKTGEVDLGKNLFKVPRDLAGHRADFAYDPVEPDIAYLEKPDGSRIRLRPAVEKTTSPPSQTEKRGEGRLQAIYDHWKGRNLPQAEAGFGLPELFALFSKHLGRCVPRDEAEARSIQDFYRAKGPLARKPTEEALRKIFTRLGPDRPLATYLAVLGSKIQSPGS